MYTDRPADRQTDTHMHLHTHMHSYKHTCTHTCTHTNTHAHTQTNTHTHVLYPEPDFNIPVETSQVLAPTPQHIPEHTYLSADLVVVQVHERPGILPDLPRVHEHLGEAEAVADVGRAAAPLPALLLVVKALLLLVTAAATQVALGAGRGDGVGHASRDDGIGEGGLFTA